MLPRRQKHRGSENIRSINGDLVWFAAAENLDVAGRNLASLELGEHYYSLLRSAYNVNPKKPLPDIIGNDLDTYLDLFKLVVETVFSGILPDDFQLEDIAQHAYQLLDDVDKEESNTAGEPYFSSYDFVYENSMVFSELIQYCISVIMSRRPKGIYLTPIGWVEDIKVFDETLSLKLTFLEADRIYHDDWEHEENINDELSE